MAVRELLHVTKLDDFKAWCVLNRIPTRPGKGPWQILQVKHRTHGWLIIYDRNSAVEHYTVQGKLEPIIRNYIRDTKRTVPMRLRPGIDKMGCLWKHP